MPAAQPLPTELLLDPREEIGETYLHLAELDLADESAIAKFVDRHGVLGVRFRGYETLGPFPRVNPTALRALKTSVRAARNEALEWFGAPMDTPWWGTGIDTEAVFIAPRAESLTEFRFGALCVRDLVSAWRSITEDHHPDKLSWEVVTPTTPEDAAALLDAAIRAALVVFSPTATFVPRAAVADEKRASAAVGSSRWTQVPLYSRCVLELFNHIVEQAEYRLCKECGRRFVRQEGRARFRQHRTRGKAASVFCSAAHASAYTTRASRQRKPAAQKDSRTGQRTTKKGKSNG